MLCTSHTRALDIHNQTHYQALEVLLAAVDGIFQIISCNDSFIIHKVRVFHSDLVSCNLAKFMYSFH